jgi:hypothetical protein
MHIRSDSCLSRLDDLSVEYLEQSYWNPHDVVVIIVNWCVVHFEYESNSDFIL